MCPDMRSTDRIRGGDPLPTLARCSRLSTSVAANLEHGTRVYMMEMILTYQI